MREKENSGVCPFCGFDESQYKHSPDHLPPRSILGGKYLTGRVLGQGGYGITYVAWELNLDLKLAIREYYPVGFVSRIGADPAVVICDRQNATEQFHTGVSLCVEEAKNLTKFFSLPGIVSVRDFFYENGTAYVVMEFVEGEPLLEHVKRCGKMEAREAIELFLPMMQSLGTIHASGLLHMDINPVNIIISPAGNAKLIDFAAAKCAYAEQHICHTPLSSTRYPAQEQYFRRGQKGPWTDIYALCGTIYYAITGIPPQEALERMMEGKLESPSALGAQITPAQEAALLKGLALLPQDRWQTMRELIEALSWGDAAAPEASANKTTQKSSVEQDVLPVAPPATLASCADESGKTMMAHPTADQGEAAASAKTTEAAQA
jgi:serine/threonine protein kinase